MKSMIISAEEQGVVEFETVGEQYTTLEVFTVVGEKVVDLVNGVVPAGTHQANFSAHALAQGRYLLVLRNGEQQRSLLFLIIR